MQAGVAQRVLQIHATRRCNLSCAHCYSSSGPDARDELSVEALESAMRFAAAEGFRMAGFSGGEPTLHEGLPQLVASAKANGLYTTVTTNGMTLRAPLLAELSPTLDLLAISLDGTKASHERIRGSPRAFDAMAVRLPLVRESKIPFGFIFTLTQYNLHELEEVASFAAEQGARLLTVHPLEIVGRAEEELPDARPDGIELAVAFAEVHRLQELFGERLLVRLDVFDRVALREHPELVHADERELTADAPLAELVAPLVIEPDGWVAPVEYGFPRALGLGNLHDAPLDVLADHWRSTCFRAFKAHCRDVFAAELAGEFEAEDRLFNWYESILREPNAS